MNGMVNRHDYNYYSTDNRKCMRKDDRTDGR